GRRDAGTRRRGEGAKRRNADAEGRDAEKGDAERRDAERGGCRGHERIARSAPQGFKVALFAYIAGFAAVVLIFAFYSIRSSAMMPMLEHFASHSKDYAETRGVPLPSLKWLGIAIAGLTIAVAAGFIAFRLNRKLFDLYLILIVAAASVALLLPGRAYI